MLIYYQNLAFVPKDFKGKPGDILVVVQMGAEMGLPPMQALQNIATINGRPSVWGDAALAICQNHPKYESIEESLVRDGEKIKAVCVIKRKGEEPYKVTFSIDDAKKAGLWGRQGPWSTYPKRMLQMRARGFALRDKFPDALKGMITREEAEDLPREIKVVTEETEYSSKADQLTDAIESSIVEIDHNEEPPQSAEDTRETQLTASMVSRLIDLGASTQDIAMKAGVGHIDNLNESHHGALTKMGIELKNKDD